MNFNNENDNKYQDLECKLKEREELRNKVERCYTHIKDYLKPSDVDFILDNFIGNKIFHKSLIKDIRDEKLHSIKITILLDNILQSDKNVILHFLELIKLVVPDIYKYITGNEVQQNQYFIGSPLRSLRETIKRIEIFQSHKAKLTKQRFEEIKKKLEDVEREIELWNGSLKDQILNNNNNNNKDNKKECLECIKLKEESFVLRKEIEFLRDMLDGKWEIDNNGLIIRRIDNENTEENPYDDICSIKLATRRRVLRYEFDSVSDSQTSSLNSSHNSQSLVIDNQTQINTSKLIETKAEDLESEISIEDTGPIVDVKKDDDSSFS